LHPLPEHAFVLLLFCFAFAFLLLLLLVLPLNPGLFLITPPFFSQEMLCKKGKAIAKEKKYKKNKNKMT
jgi:hypothetical protein